MLFRSEIGLMYTLEHDKWMGRLSVSVTCLEPRLSVSSRPARLAVARPMRIRAPAAVARSGTPVGPSTRVGLERSFLGKRARPRVRRLWDDSVHAHLHSKTNFPRSGSSATTLLGRVVRFRTRTLSAHAASPGHRDPLRGKRHAPRVAATLACMVTAQRPKPAPSVPH